MESARLVCKDVDGAELAAFVVRIQAILDRLPDLYAGSTQSLSSMNMAEYGFGDVEFHTTFYGPLEAGPANPLTRHLEVSVEAGDNQMAELVIKLCIHPTISEFEIREWVHYDRSNVLGPNASVHDIAAVLERLRDWASRPVYCLDDDDPTPGSLQLSQENYAAVEKAYTMIHAERSSEYFDADPRFTLWADAPYRLPQIAADAGATGRFNDLPCLTDIGQHILAKFVPIQPQICLHRHSARPSYIIRGNSEPVGCLPEPPTSIDLMKQLQLLPEITSPAVLSLPI